MYVYILLRTQRERESEREREKKKRPIFLLLPPMLLRPILASESHDASLFGVGDGVLRRLPYHASGMPLGLPTPLGNMIKMQEYLKRI